MYNGFYAYSGSFNIWESIYAPVLQCCSMIRCNVLNCVWHSSSLQRMFLKLMWMSKKELKSRNLNTCKFPLVYYGPISGIPRGRGNGQGAGI